MLDNSLITLIIAQVKAGLTTIGQNAIQVVANFQPTNQGANTAPTLYLYKIGDVRIGVALRQTVWDQAAMLERHTETQQYETTFQFSALATQDPSNPGLTASDIANYAAYVLQSDAFIAAIQAQGVGILRVSDVRNPFVKLDKDRFEAEPSFDFVLTHKQVITGTVPTILTEVFQILPV